MSGTKKQIIVIGGGAAGLMAAIAAARQGAEVMVLERLSRVGKKLLATGNGRCNYTNTQLDISRYHGNNPDFASPVLQRFGTDQTILFFSRLGIVPMIEQKGKVFPRSAQAGSILDVLRYELDCLGVDVICDEEVTQIDVMGKGFALSTRSGRRFSSQSVIITTGGKASPNLGSNGSGYILAQNLGHSLIPPFPALVQLKLKASFLKQLAGIKVEGTAEILEEDRSVAMEAGEILFTTYGVSGPPILQISRAAGESLRKGKIPYLKLNIIPDISRRDLEAHLERRLEEEQASKTLDFSFVGFINKQLAPVIIKEAGVSDIRKPAGQVTPQEKKRLLTILQDWRFEIRDTLPWSQAQVTAGGLNADEVDPQTMESRLIPSLYFAGEVLDIDGGSGGFNLQWAWASGFIAGTSAAEGL